MANGNRGSSPPTPLELGDPSANFNLAAFDILPEDLLDGDMSQCEVVVQTSSEAESARVRPKACLVCGDQAQGLNFGIVACGSCKAFFRRNALKSKIVPCLFSGSCSVTSATRSFCPACRLDKCLANGMRTDLIMSQEAKKQRNEMIQRNKKRNLERCPLSTASPREGGELDADCSSSSRLSLHRDGGGRDSSSSSSSCINSTSNGAEVKAPCEQSPASQMTAGDNWLGELDVRPVKHESRIRDSSADAPSGVGAAPPPGDSSSVEVVVSGRFATVLRHVETALVTSALCLQRRLVSGDEARLGSLTFAYQSTVGLDPGVDAPEPAEGFNMQLFATRMSNVLRRMVLFAKETSHFASLPRSMQVRLLRAGAMACILIRSAELLDLPSGYWQDACGKKMSLDDLKQVAGDSIPDQFFIEHLVLSASVKQLVPASSGGQCDRTVFALLMMIALLSPDCVSGVSDCGDDSCASSSDTGPAIVSDAQQHYVALLRRHLEATYSFQLCSGALPALLQQIGVLKRYSKSQSSGFMSCLPVRSDPLCQEVLGP